MRLWLLILAILEAMPAIFAQEAFDPASASPGQKAMVTLQNAWLDLRQSSKNGQLQSAPDWVESVTLTPLDAKSNTGRSTFRIRISKVADTQKVLFFRLFFSDRASAQPEIVAWDESGSEVLRSGPLGSGIDLESSESVMIPMRGITAIDVDVPGDGTSVRGAYLEWMTSSELIHPASAGTQDSIPQPFALTTPLHANARDQEQFGTVTATLSADPIRIGATPGEAALFQFGLESQPLVALVTFEVAGLRIDSPPELIVNGENAGPVSLILPDLADPGYRGQMQGLVNQMQFQYTGWVRAQKMVPLNSLHPGTNDIAIVNGPNSSGTAAIRATQIQLKYLWDKSDYILKPAH